MGLVNEKKRVKVTIQNKRKISEPPFLEYEDFTNYKEMSSYLGYFNLIKKLDIVMAPSSEIPLYIGNCEFMNINYFFNYLLRRTSMSVKLNESIFAGGKGFTLYKAICSSLGEAFERLMACLEYFEQKELIELGSYHDLQKKGMNAIHPHDIRNFSADQFMDENFLFEEFHEDTYTSWIKMEELNSGDIVYIPACLILMYYKPQTPEEKRIGYATSGGLTSHYLEHHGIGHGLMEIIERHEINLSWYCQVKPEEIIIDKIHNKQLERFKDYIKEKNIRFFRHNVDQQNFHVITAMSFDDDMTKYSFNTGGGISSDIEKAILASMEEYTQAVNNTRKIVYAPNWLTSKFSNGVLDVNEDDDPKHFKTFYQAVSYYGLKSNQHKLNWYVKGNQQRLLSDIKENQTNQNILDYVKKHHLNPYISRLLIGDRFKHIYISKVFMKEFTPAFIAGVPVLGHEKYDEYLAEGVDINNEILPFP
ncbi:YcaO-like family protein [Metabacillus schmidteae]|uniref:YcaO-like family protein n=1 Tax=Metabacillus schmidteae TaxID=2730405 RepID=UPI00158A3373|nr:YcaO-like family protein [Metabacillus schmidteae]